MCTAIHSPRASAVLRLRPSQSFHPPIPRRAIPSPYRVVRSCCTKPAALAHSASLGTRVPLTVSHRVHTGASTHTASTALLRAHDVRSKAQRSLIMRCPNGRQPRVGYPIAGPMHTPTTFRLLRESVGCTVPPMRNRKQVEHAQRQSN
jgi:hypothetical protein